jgi:hypothetical protein
MAVAGTAAAGEMQDLRSRVPKNPFAFIPPQCYTRTLDADGTVHNPCYACHVASAAPNYVDDGDLQTLYDFPEPALVNRWSNMFVDRRPAIAAQTDADILRYVRADKLPRRQRRAGVARSPCAGPRGLGHQPRRRLVRI